MAMPTKPTQLRIPPELLEFIDQAANDREMSRTAWICEAARSHLKVNRPDRKPDLTPNTELGEVEVTTVPVADISFPVQFKCPAYGCDYKAGSERARCNFHGRLVVPI